MKRQIGLALCILALLFLSSPIFGGAGGQLITTYSTATTRISYVNGSAFFWVDGQDLSGYADPHYKFEIVDAEGDKLTGVGLTVGAGETLGSELVTDGGFAAVTETNIYTSNFSVGVDGFIAISGAVAGNIDAIGGQDDNLRFTTNNLLAGAHTVYKSALLNNYQAYRDRQYTYIPSAQSNIDGVLITDNSGAVIDTITTLDAWTATDKYFVTTTGIHFRNTALDGGSAIFQDADGDDVFYIRGIIVDNVTFTSWTAGTAIAPGVSVGALTNKAQFTAASSSLSQAGILTDNALHKIVHTLDYTSGTSMKVYAGTTGGTARASDSTFTEYLTAVGTDLSLTGTAITATEDDVSAKVVTDAPATGVQIVDAKGSATRNWTAKDANFDFDEATYTVNVYRLDQVMIIQ